MLKEGSFGSMSFKVDITQYVFLSRCQLQVFLRLEMCLQCPSMHDSIDDMERVVEEVRT